MVSINSFGNSIEASIAAIIRVMLHYFENFKL